MHTLTVCKECGEPMNASETGGDLCTTCMMQPKVNKIFDYYNNIRVHNHYDVCVKNPRRTNYSHVDNRLVRKKHLIKKKTCVDCKEIYRPESSNQLRCEACRKKYKRPKREFKFYLSPGIIPSGEYKLVKCSLKDLEKIKSMSTDTIFTTGQSRPIIIYVADNDYGIHVRFPDTYYKSTKQGE